MPTQKQIAANRRNALKSTGPRTPEGKARSSMNALKTGIDSRSHTVPGESISQLEALTTEYYDRYCPTTPAQRAQLDILIDAEWLLRRLRRVEAQLWEKPHIYEQTLHEAFRQDSQVFARLQRRIDATQRNYRTALHELERLQAAETAEALAAEPEPVQPTSCNQTPNPRDGFVPQPHPDGPAHPPATPATLPAQGF